MIRRKFTHLFDWLVELTPAATTAIYLFGSLSWLFLVGVLFDHLFGDEPELRRLATQSLDLLGVFCMAVIVFVLT